MKNKLNSFSYVFLGIIFIVEAVWSFCGGKIYIKYTGWIEPSIQMTIASMAIGIIFICIGIFYNSKHSDFMRCKKCHKVYNYVDVKDKDKICPKCGGELQDYKEFEKEEQEKKNKEFKRIDKIEKELIEKYKKSKK